MPSSVVDNSANIFDASAFDSKYWDNYTAARPKYSPEFYALISDYHKGHGNGVCSIAHDVGAGPGQVARAVLPWIDRVFLSDINERHLDAARHYLLQVPDQLAKTSFTCCSGTQLAEKFENGEADFVLAGESLALMDVDVALGNFAKLLKSGGTAAIWYYGRPMFAEEPYAAECQRIYDRIVNKAFSKIIKGGGPAKQKQWKVTTDVMASWFDSVAFPESLWAHVERHKWNTDGQMTFYDDSACDFEVTRSSKISSGDRLFEQLNRAFWADKWSVQDVKKFVDVNLPVFAGSDAKDEQIGNLYQELDVAMGGQGAKRDIAWPVVLLLATRK